MALIDPFISPLVEPYFSARYYTISPFDELQYLDLTVRDEILLHWEFALDDWFYAGNRQRTLHWEFALDDWFYSSKKQRTLLLDMKKFGADDSIICCGRTGFHSRILSRKADWIRREIFEVFCRYLYHNRSRLESGEAAERFLNMCSLFGVEKWKGWEGCPAVESYFWSVYPAIMKGIFKKKSSLLLTKFWVLFCVTDEMRIRLFKYVPDAKHLKFMLQVGNRIKFDFWKMRHGSDKFNESVVSYYIKHGKFDMVEMLLDYGFNLEKGIPKENRTIEWCYPFSNSYLILDWGTHIPKKLLVWILCMVFAMHPDVDPITMPGFVQLLRKLHRSLPEPSEPASALRTHLQSLISYHVSLFAAGRQDAFPPWSIQSAVQDIIRPYEKCRIHPEDEGVTPRSLSHLSRCVIRERLAANYQLPAAIRKLELPTKIKNYLSLES